MKQSSPAQPTLADLLETTSQRSDTRCCFLLWVRPEKLAEYVDVHQRVWDSMRDARSESGWRNYSLFLRPATGMIVGYFEADDTQAAIDAMGKTAINATWQAEMAQYFVQPDGGTNEYLSQYFYLA